MWYQSLKVKVNGSSSTLSYLSSMANSTSQELMIVEWKHTCHFIQIYMFVSLGIQTTILYCLASIVLIAIFMSSAF